MSFSGLYDVNIYDNKKYGSIIEIKKKKDLLFYKDIINIDVNMYRNKTFYYATKDYFIIANNHQIYYDKNNYYIDINKIDNIDKIIEYGYIIYNLKDIKNMVFIQ